MQILEYPAPQDGGKWVVHKVLQRVADDLRSAGVDDDDVLAIDYDDRALYDDIDPLVRVIVRLPE